MTIAGHTIGLRAILHSLLSRRARLATLQRERAAALAAVEQAQQRRDSRALHAAQARARAATTAALLVWVAR